MPREVASPDTAPQEGVQLIHVIPDGVACVRDQIAPDAPPGTLESFLAEKYQDDALAQELAKANHLLPDEQGKLTVYVPPGQPVIIPAMCYFKEGATGVTIEANGAPETSNSGPSAAWTALVVVIVVALVVYALRRFLT